MKKGKNIGTATGILATAMLSFALLSGCSTKNNASANTAAIAPSPSYANLAGTYRSEFPSYDGSADYFSIANDGTVTLLGVPGESIAQVKIGSLKETNEANRFIIVFSSEYINQLETRGVDTKQLAPFTVQFQQSRSLVLSQSGNSSMSFISVNHADAAPVLARMKAANEKWSKQYEGDWHLDRSELIQKKQLTTHLGIGGNAYQVSEDSDVPINFLVPTMISLTEKYRMLGGLTLYPKAVSKLAGNDSDRPVFTRSFKGEDFSLTVALLVFGKMTPEGIVRESHVHRYGTFPAMPNDNGMEFTTNLVKHADGEEELLLTITGRSDAGLNINRWWSRSVFGENLFAEKESDRKMLRFIYRK